MYGETIKNKISELEANLNDKSSGLEQKVQDIAEGVLVVADVVDELPTIIKEEVSSLDNKVSKEIKSLNDKIAKVKTIKGEKGDRGEAGIDGLDGKDGANGKDGSPDTPEQIADKLNTLEGVIDSKVIKGYNGTDIEELKRQVSTIGNQTLRLLSKPATSTTTTGGGTVDSIVAGTNVSVDSTDPKNPIVSASFSQTGKYLISGGAVWSGTGLIYDVSILSYFFNGLKSSPITTSVTLDASDPTFNRIDGIVVDEVGNVSVVKGDASSSPVSPAIDDDQLLVQFILVEAASTEPTIAMEAIYLDDPTTNWTFSTYDTGGTGTGTINFAGTNSPKQGVNDIEASTDARRGARFVRATSFDAFQYTMMSVWVRFTGTAVATNKSLNVRFENSAGTLVGSTINLFSYGLSRSILNTWQLVVVPITAFGALPATVKGLKVIMAGGTVGVVRQWDLDYLILTNGSVPQANVPTIVFAKDGTNIASQSGINLIEGTGVTINAVNNPTNNRVDYTINASGGGGTPAGSDNQIQINQSGSFFADSTFQKSDTGFNVGLDHTVQSPITFTGSGLDDLTLTGKFSGTLPTTYTVTIDGVNVDIISIESSTISGGTFAVGNTITNGLGGIATVNSVVEVLKNASTLYTYLGVTITTGTFGNGDTIDNGSGVTGTGSYEQTDTFTETDGTTTVSNVPTKDGISTLNGITLIFNTSTGHTLSDSWTWTYSTVNQNVLDFSNNDYKFQSTLGTDTFGYQITDNLFGFGIAGSVNTYTNVAGDFGFSGFSYIGDTTVNFSNTIFYSDGHLSSLELGKNRSRFGAGGGGLAFDISSNDDNFQVVGTNSGIKYGISQSSGAVTLGDIDGGNNTKITIDDVNEQITISNLPSYDDDTAAGTAGLTAGMVYMTTGSGSAPLNVAGILMIKQ